MSFDYSRKVGWGYIQALLLLIVATLINQLLKVVVAPTNLVMLYLLAVVIASVRWGYGPAIVTSTLSVLIFNYFFVPHEYTLLVEDAQYILTFIGLFVVGMTIAYLNNRLQQQAAAVTRREEQTSELYSMSRDLVTTTNQQQIIDAVLQHIHDTFHAEAAILIFGDGKLHLHGKTANFYLEANDYKIAGWTYEHLRHAGCGTPRWSYSHSICVPLATAQEKLGVLVLRIASQISEDSEYRHLIDSFANQAALAIEAARLATEAQQMQLLRDREKLQSALLNSISHDLRTPLVSIAGALSTLKDNTLMLTEAARQDMVEGAWQDVQRLNRTVANLLDMTRLQSGMIRLQLNWFHVQELIANTRTQLKDRLATHQLVVDVPSDLPLIEIDLTLMVQVMVNLLDNAVKYSSEDTTIEITARYTDDTLWIEIADEGIGIPDADLPYIFDRFYRADLNGGIGGTGLGLSICEGIVATHHGTITAENRPTGGTVFRVTLPLQQARAKSDIENDVL